MHLETDHTDGPPGLCNAQFSGGGQVNMIRSLHRALRWGVYAASEFYMAPHPYSQEKSDQPNFDFELRLGRDFLNEDSILASIIAALQELELYRPELLACGYDADADSDDLVRSTLFAVSLADYAQAIDSGRILKNPLSYALTETDQGRSGHPVISIYEPDYFIAIGPDHYATRKSCPIQDALVATFWFYLD